ncbi:MAG: DUF4360 domain-containing protein [Nostoc sp. DedQUE08]|uniref:DUF4360 domain-containing protein n=1 Tax=unclassified Nostoc TaxID=2593658 RepID=UPI002AD35C00|nr:MULTISPECIES: DUF4360 domain-containing protein [unclassified Nostoc]MDZ8071016.1 DUF4360 domain-containing protein [Nostoc sp. DedQUE08]MDZ8091301.1 DUF4360 domain-containing protein [Nostoc sp. DedQUE05]MDZ8130543.1 DUF4360 domain-containing protein [Nostoc sp. DedQUE07]
MNFKQFGLLLSLTTILGINAIATKALADEPSITFGDAIGSGGCSVADQLPGDDGRSLSIVLDNFSAFNGQRQKCILRVQTFIPSGFIVQDVQVLYQGTTDIDSKSKGTSLNRTYSFSGGALGQAVAPPKTSKFTSSKAFAEQDEITVLAATGLCSGGGQGLLGINMIAQSSRGSSIFVDTADLNAGDVRLYFDLRRC